LAKKITKEITRKAARESNWLTFIDYESADLWLYRFAVKHSAREEGVESHLLDSSSFQARAITEITTRDDPLTLAFVERILLKDRNLEFKAFFQSLVL
jgi:hypothetical protein